MKRKWIEVNDLSGGQYSVDKNVRFKTPIPISDLYDYNDVYIVVKERISFRGTNANNRPNKKLTLVIMFHSSYTYQKLITHL